MNGYIPMRSCVHQGRDGNKLENTVSLSARSLHTRTFRGHEGTLERSTSGKPIAKRPQVKSQHNLSPRRWLRYQKSVAQLSLVSCRPAHMVVVDRHPVAVVLGVQTVEEVVVYLRHVINGAKHRHFRADRDGNVGWLAAQSKR